MPIPIWNKNQGGIIKAQGEVAVAEQSLAQLELELQQRLAPVFERLGLTSLPPTADPGTARTSHSDAFRRLHDEFSTVRRIDPGAAW